MGAKRAVKKRRQPQGAPPEESGSESGSEAGTEPGNEKDKLFRQLSQISRLASLGSLSSGIAHEVNNPLVAVKGFAQLIEMDPSASSQVRDQAREIIKASVRIQRVCDHLRNYAKEIGQEDWGPVDINETIGQSMILLSQQLMYRRITVREELAGGISPVWGVRNWLERIFHNLLTNSRDAFGRTRSDLDRTISISSSAKGKDWVKIVYEDNAGGIPEILLSQVFEPFFTTKEEKSAAGLGLAIVKDIVTRHNGTLDFQTKEGDGTRITLLLPVREAIPQPKAKLEVVGKSKPTPVQKWRMLVVDDESVAAEVVALYTKDDFITDVITDSRVAIKKIETERYDLIVTDLNMPHLTGLELLLKVKALGLETPVIIMSGYGDADDEVAQAMSQGAAAFLPKPFEGPKEVRDFLRGCVSKEASRSLFEKK